MDKDAETGKSKRTFLSLHFQCKVTLALSALSFLFLLDQCKVEPHFLEFTIDIIIVNMAFKELKIQAVTYILLTNEVFFQELLFLKACSP